MYRIEFTNNIEELEDRKGLYDTKARAFTTAEEALYEAVRCAQAAGDYLKKTAQEKPCVIYSGEGSASIRFCEILSAHWEVHNNKNFEIHIESRNQDGDRLVHEFLDPTSMLNDMNSDDPTMGDNEILLVVVRGNVIYSSLMAKRNEGNNILWTEELRSWFENQ